MRFLLRLFPILLVLLSPSWANSEASIPDSKEHHQLLRSDGSQLTVIVDRQVTEQKIPIVLAIAGSTCLASEYGVWVEELAPENTENFDFALVIVEKSGAIKPAAVDGEIRYTPDLCGDEV